MVQTIQIQGSPSLCVTMIWIQIDRITYVVCLGVFVKKKLKLTLSVFTLDMTCCIVFCHSCLLFHSKSHSLCIIGIATVYLRMGLCLILKAIYIDALVGFCVWIAGTTKCGSVYVPVCHCWSLLLLIRAYCVFCIQQHSCLCE